MRDDLRPARGIVNGMVIGGILWIVIGIIAWLVS